MPYLSGPRHIPSMRIMCKLEEEEEENNNKLE